MFRQFTRSASKTFEDTKIKVAIANTNRSSSRVTNLFLGSAIVTYVGFSFCDLT